MTMNGIVAHLGMVELASHCLRSAGIPLDLYQTTLGKLEGDRRVGSLLRQRAFDGDLSLENIDAKEFRRWGRLAVQRGH